jgi:DNA-binding GntR family transcriptional regulator
VPPQRSAAWSAVKNDRNAGSAAERVYRWVRGGILDGSLAAGRLLSEGEIADAMNVSRTPVREAFLQLAAEDMLELYPKRGALVLSVTAIELREVLVARALIEPWAATVVSAMADRGACAARLRALIGQQHQALEAGDRGGFQEADRGFHEQLVAAAGNAVLARFYSGLRDRQIRGGMLALRNAPDRGVEILAQHDAIVDALERGDAGGAADAVRHHLEGTALALGLAPLA